MRSGNRPQDGRQERRETPIIVLSGKGGDGTTGAGRQADRELVEAAARVAAERSHDDLHTVAAAARARDGGIFTAMNVHHFTGGPCAEVVVIGAAATHGAHELDAIVAVGDLGRGALPPCGRCRQLLLDCFPGIVVIVGTGDRLRAVPIGELLPESHIWIGQQQQRVD